MTKREAAIVSAYTGYLLGSYVDLVNYVEGKLGHKVWDFDLAVMEKQVHELSTNDFLELKVE